MTFLNSAAVGLLGALKDKGLREENLSQFKNLSFDQVRNYLLQNYILEEYREEAGKDLKQLEHYLNLTHLRLSAKFLRFLKGEKYDFIKTFLREYDVYNIKLIVRGIVSGNSFDRDSIYIFPFSLFRKDLPEFRNIDELFAFLHRDKEYREILKSSYQEYKRRGDYFYFEMKLDQMWLNLLKSKASFLGKEISSVIEEWEALIYLNWSARLLFLQKRKKEEVLSFLDLTNPYFDTHLFNQLSTAKDLNSALELISSSEKFKGLLINDDWQSSLEDFYYSRISKKFESGVFSIIPILKFLFQQRYYLERMIWLLNQKVSSYV